MMCIVSSNTIGVHECTNQLFPTDLHPCFQEMNSRPGREFTRLKSRVERWRWNGCGSHYRAGISCVSLVFVMFS